MCGRTGFLLLGAISVGALDIAEVILFYFYRGVAPTRVLQGVAAGLLGRASFEGGMRTAMIGLALHFFIAFVVVLVYHLAARRWPLLVRRPVIIGALYGLAVYLVMTYVVVANSAAASRRTPPWAVTANLLFAHIACVGIPTALSARAAEGGSQDVNAMNVNL